jgi:MFS family permease
MRAGHEFHIHGILFVKPNRGLVKQFRLILLARTLRNTAFGGLAVVFALALAARGLDALMIGSVFTLALLSGAVFAAATGWLTSRLGVRGTLVAASIAMALAGVLLVTAPNLALIVVAVLLGTVSPTGQDVGPFIPVEQALIAGEGEHGEASMRRFSTYNIVGNSATAVGALFAAAFSPAEVLIAYAVTGVLLAGVYRSLPVDRVPQTAAPKPGPSAPLRFGVVEQLTLLFGVDALAGGFVVQSFLAYWFHVRFGVGSGQLGLLLFGANMLATLSLVAAPWLSKRIGLLPTMVFTHLPSNLLLIAVPFMPTYPLAVVVLLARFALSQMDVPTRQAFTMALVPPEDRARAAGWTNAVRPAAAAAAPVLAGLALQNAAFFLPFVVAGGLKAAYDLALLAVFSRHRELR